MRFHVLDEGGDRGADDLRIIVQEEKISAIRCPRASIGGLAIPQISIILDNVNSRKLQTHHRGSSVRRSIVYIDQLFRVGPPLRAGERGEASPHKFTRVQANDDHRDPVFLHGWSFGHATALALPAHPTFGVGSAMNTRLWKATMMLAINHQAFKGKKNTST